MKKEVIASLVFFEDGLRVLSPQQRKQVSLITKDWRRFTIGLYTEMFNKL